jgi:3-oxoacyl-(acyl-carrier-protein) synthase
LKEGRIPPTLNVENVDDTLDENLLRIVSERFEQKNESNDIPKLVLKNSFGFGGTNVSLLLAEFKD